MNPLQEMINDTLPGDMIKVPAGTYDVDVDKETIMLREGVTVDLSLATLVALPSAQRGYKILWAKDVHDVEVRGGKIIGERDRHLVPIPLAGPEFPPDWSGPIYDGGWGMGVSITGACRNITVKGTHISRCYGDGFYVDWDSVTRKAPTAVLVDGVTCIGNRRQGMSVICVDGMRIRNSTFADNGRPEFGTIPGAGIDFECDPWFEADGKTLLPDNMQQWIKNIVIEGNNQFCGNRGSSIGFNGHPGVYQNLRVEPGCEFDLKTRPIWTAGGLDGKTPWWAMVLNRLFGKTDNYRYWGYPTSWST